MFELLIAGLLQAFALFGNPNSTVADTTAQTTSATATPTTDPTPSAGGAGWGDRD